MSFGTLKTGGTQKTNRIIQKQLRISNLISEIYEIEILTKERFGFIIRSNQYAVRRKAIGQQTGLEK